MNLPIAILIIIFMAGMTVFIFKNGVRMDQLTPEEQDTVLRTRCKACRMSRYCNDSKRLKGSGDCKAETSNQGSKISTD